MSRIEISVKAVAFAAGPFVLMHNPNRGFGVWGLVMLMKCSAFAPVKSGLLRFSPSPRKAAAQIWTVFCAIWCLIGATCVSDVQARDKNRDRGDRQEARQERRAEREERRAEREERQTQREEAREERQAERAAEREERAAERQEAIESREDDNNGGSDQDNSGDESEQSPDDTSRADNGGSSDRDRDRGNRRDRDRADGGKSKKKNRGDRDNKDDDQDDEPPATVFEAIERLITPTPVTVPVQPQTTIETTVTPIQKSIQTPTSAPVQATVEQKKSTKTVAEKAEATKSNGLRVATVGYEQYDFENGPRSGVLALNPDKATLDHARAKGFKVVESSQMSKLKVRVARLVPPTGMSVSEAERTLRLEMPTAELTVNQKYSLFKTAMGAPDNPQHGAPRAPNEPACESDHCFGRELIGWQKDLNACAAGLKIGVVDTAIDLSHPAFQNKKIEMRSVSAKDSKGGTNWHGTGVLGLLAGGAQGGIDGLIPDSEFYVADVFFADGDGQPASDTMSLLRALEWLRDQDVKIINMSLSGPPDILMQQAIERMSAAGVVIVAAAGNEGPGSPPSYPAAYPQVLAVTAVGKDLRGYRYANQGDYIDMAAPGVAVWTALPGGKQGYQSGTSFAAPYATAAVAAVYAGLPVKSKPAVLQSLATLDIGPVGRDTIYGKGLMLAPDLCPVGRVASAQRPNTKKAKFQPAMALTSAPVTPNEVLPWLTADGR